MDSFSDEAVSFAAGHRPCVQCRRAAYGRFVSAWKAGHGIAPETFLPAMTIDAALHQARVMGDRKQKRFTATLGELPDGVFLILPDEPEASFLLWGGQLHPWSHSGYGPARHAHPDAAVTILTPAPTVAALRCGYVPAVLQPIATQTED